MSASHDELRPIPSATRNDRPEGTAAVCKGISLRVIVASGLLSPTTIDPTRECLASEAPSESQSDARRDRHTARDDTLGDCPASEAVRYFFARCGRLPNCKDEISVLLNCDIADLDGMLSQQVNEILHQRRFQELEASWRGLLHLVTVAEGAENVEIRVLDVSKPELHSDLTTALEFDQSELFRKVYEAEYGTAGGTPYGVLIADYYFSHGPNDIELLTAVSGIAASAFCPFIAGVAPQMFGIDSFDRLPQIHNLESYFNTTRFLKWRAMRETEDARFVGLVLTQILMRLPYVDDTRRDDGFIFREDVSGSQRSKYLWGNAAFAFGGVLIRAFLDHGWYADIRGAHRQGNRGGRVEGLPVHSFNTDTRGVAIKSSVATAIDERLERQLSDLGFIPLCDCQDTPYAVFHANQSLQRPKVYHDDVATANAKLSAMIQYIMCSSRFAHYLKVLARDRLGGTTAAAALESELHSWIQRYVSQDPGASQGVKAKFPLRQALIKLRDHPAKPGHFFADFFLWPHFQLDELTASVKLVSEL